MLGLVLVEIVALGATIGFLAQPTVRTPHDIGVVPDVFRAVDPVARTAGATGTGSSEAAALPSPPRRLAVQSLGIDATVLPTSVGAGGALLVPADVQQLGWWSGGAEPGSRQGTVVIVGHVDAAAQGTGQFFSLERAVPGQVVTVTTADGLIRYVVAARRVFEKQVLPTSIFAVTGRPRLVMVTCGGPFDAAARSYRDNIVVYATPVR